MLAINNGWLLGRLQTDLHRSDFILKCTHDADVAQNILLKRITSEDSMSMLSVCYSKCASPSLYPRGVARK